MDADLLITAVALFGSYSIIKIVSDHFLKRKIIKSGHFEKAEILSPLKNESDEANKYPALKWGLVAFMAGLGFIIIDLLRAYVPELITFENSVLPIGIEFIFISLGFLIYFYIVTLRKKR